MDFTELMKSQEECERFHENYSIPGNYCKPLWFNGSGMCWPPTAAGRTASHLCTVFNEDAVAVGTTTDRSLIAFKACLDNGFWNKTDFRICMDNLDSLMLRRPTSLALGWIIVVCSILSMLSLGISLFIFCYFRCLYCSRLKVHCNMCVALMIYLVSVFPFGLETLFLSLSLQKAWLYKLFLFLNVFSGTACCAWMFVEGLLLHSRVTVRIFQRDAPFKLYYFIGWCVPLILTTAWAVAMHFNSTHPRWFDYKSNNYRWIAGAAQCAALLVNAVFLVNVIRVLLTKRQAENTTDIIQLKKAVRATALLFPLLGMPHLLSTLSAVLNEDVYLILSTTCWSIQGLAFGVIYCFSDSDVQKAVRNAYLRAVISRNPNRMRFKANRCLSRTSNTYISSNSNGTQLDSSLYKARAHSIVKPDERAQMGTIIHTDKHLLSKQESLTMV